MKVVLNRQLFLAHLHLLCLVGEFSLLDSPTRPVFNAMFNPIRQRFTLVSWLDYLLCWPSRAYWGSGANICNRMKAHEKVRKYTKAHKNTKTDSIIQRYLQSMVVIIYSPSCHAEHRNTLLTISHRSFKKVIQQKISSSKILLNIGLKNELFPCRNKRQP